LSIQADEFSQALGAFVWTFSIVEAELQRTLWSLVGIPAPIGRAIVSNPSVRGGIDTIKRLSQSQSWSADRVKETNYALDQLIKIAEFRNGLLHYGAYRLGGDYIISNREWVHAPSRIRELRITPQTLLDAVEDLADIRNRLLVLWGSTIFPAEILQELHHQLKNSWKFEPPPPAWPG
jgi:hypothetical protein